MTKIPIIYGTLISLGIFIWVLVMFSLGYYGDQKSEMSSLDYLSIIVPVLGFYIGIKAERSNKNGILTFGNGFIIGLYITIVYAILSTLLFLIYYKFIDIDSLKFAAKYYGMEDDPINKVMLMDLGVQLVSSLVMGLILSVVFSLTLKKNAATASI